MFPGRRTSLLALPAALFALAFVVGLMTRPDLNARARLSHRIEYIRRDTDVTADTDAVSGGDVERPERQHRKRLPNVLIIGAKKCGTTTLQAFLNVHPQIKGSLGEVHFFDAHYDKGLDWYVDQMVYSDPDDVTIERSPRYFVTKAAPARVEKMNSTVKLILLLREPVQRLVSDYAHEMYAGRAESRHPIEKFVFDSEGRVNASYAAVRVGMYYKHLANWLQYFPMRQILVLNGDDLTESPYPTLRKVETFLGLPHLIKPKWFYYSKSKGFYCIRKGGKKDCMGGNKGRKHPYVKPDTLKRLGEFYKPLNKLISEMTGIVF